MLQSSTRRLESKPPVDGQRQELLASPFSSEVALGNASCHNAEECSMLPGIAVTLVAHTYYTSSNSGLPQGRTVVVVRILLALSSLILLASVILFHFDLAFVWMWAPRESSVAFQVPDDAAVWAVTISGLVGSSSSLICIPVTFTGYPKSSASPVADRITMMSNWVFQSSPALASSRLSLNGAVTAHRNSRLEILRRSFENPPANNSVSHSRYIDPGDMSSPVDSPYRALNTSTVSATFPCKEAIVDMKFKSATISGKTAVRSMLSFKPVESSGEAPSPSKSLPQLMGILHSRAWSSSPSFAFFDAEKSEAPIFRMPSTKDVSECQQETATPSSGAFPAPITPSPSPSHENLREYDEDYSAQTSRQLSTPSHAHNALSLITFTSSSNSSSSSGPVTPLSFEVRSTSKRLPYVWPDLSLLLPWNPNISASSSFEHLNIDHAETSGTCPQPLDASALNFSPFPQCPASTPAYETSLTVAKPKPAPPPRSESRSRATKPTPPVRSTSSLEGNSATSTSSFHLPVISLPKPEQVPNSAVRAQQFSYLPITPVGGLLSQRNLKSVSKSSDHSFRTPYSGRSSKSSDPLSASFKSCWATDF
ncbi:flocculation protein FLO11-like [Penaeus chinensis]|uniref:flocculation protein FLO11-like n=1 Tax=Penaeus chinensis TaxID=139456 RepID=UPI001FB81A77|nr:flocculation protein FLO11-like [Penaeus chinensis]